MSSAIYNNLKTITSGSLELITQNNGSYVHPLIDSDISLGFTDLSFSQVIDGSFLVTTFEWTAFSRTNDDNSNNQGFNFNKGIFKTII